jgi:membrane peptidoglycan carboxypeptidase
MAHELGIESEVDAYPSTAIGGLRVGVTPLEMASAYSTFANAGTHMEPYLVQKVPARRTARRRRSRSTASSGTRP